MKAALSEKPLVAIQLSSANIALEILENALFVKVSPDFPIILSPADEVFSGPVV
jgi:hypothetical protein